jgi:ribosomal protein L11 methyltransferase
VTRDEAGVMGQLAISIDLEGRDAAAVEDACFAAGALSVVLTDRRDDAILEPRPGEIRLWPSTRLQAIFPADCASPAALVELARAVGCRLEDFLVEYLADRPWEREWLKDFAPMRFGEQLWICPSHTTIDDPAAIVVTLDPGLAFGTGTHPTTRLCLEFLDEAARGIHGGGAGGYIVDYGCGSGVLAIAALALDHDAHARVHDIDPQALIATRDNAVVNGVESRIEFFANGAALAQACKDEGARLVLANILSGPLCELAPRLGRLLAPGATLVLAGLLAEQADEVIAAYAPEVALSRWRELEGWVCLAGTRR